jgi:catechol-2,3-dioxygenase
MEFHRGRLFDHVHLRVKDLDASKRFYRAVLDAGVFHGLARRSAASVVVTAGG